MYNLSSVYLREPRRKIYSIFTGNNFYTISGRSALQGHHHEVTADQISIAYLPGSCTVQMQRQRPIN
jgi:hypothetical protein